MIGTTLKSRFLAVFAGLPREIWLLAGAAFINFLGYMALPFLILYLTGTVGYSIESAGTLLAVYGVGGVAGAWFGGHLCDRIGSGYTLLASFVGSAALLCLLPYLLSVFVVASICLFVLSFFQGSFRPAYDSCVVAVCPADERSRAYSLYVAAINIGAAVGTASGGIAFSIKPELVFWLNGVASLAASVWVFLIVLPALTNGELRARNANESGTNGVASGAGKVPWRDTIFLTLCAGVFIVETIGRQPTSTLPLYMTQHYGLSSEEFGRMLTLGHILFALLMLPIASWTKKYEPRIVASIGVFVIACGYGALPLGTSAFSAVFLYIAILSGQLLFYPSVVSIVMEAAASSKGRSGSYMGAYRSTQSVAAITAPAIGTWAYSAFSPNVLWYGCGATGVAVAVFFSIERIRTRKSDSDS